MQRKIKVLHIQETIGSGGVERRRLSLAKHLDKNTYEIKVVCQHEIGNIGDEIRKNGVEVISLKRSLKNIFDFRQHRKVQKIINDFQPDIIHGAVFEGVILAAVNGWLKKVPVIIIEETSDPQSRSRMANFLMKLLARMSNAVVGVSPAVSEEYLLGKLHLSSEKVVLINNGVARPRPVSEQEIVTERKKWDIADDDFVIGSAGRMRSDQVKRYSDLIRAFAQFAEQKTKVKLLLVGGNEKFLEVYRTLADDLGVTDKVIFTGYQQEISVFYKMMDVFALVSASESFGLVLAEAMLNDLPVIATRVGGMKYIVKDRETGFLVELYNVHEIAEKIEILYADADLRKQMGIKGKQRADENYTEEVYVQRVHELYQKFVPKILK